MRLLFCASVICCTLLAQVTVSAHRISEASGEKSVADQSPLVSRTGSLSAHSDPRANDNQQASHLAGIIDPAAFGLPTGTDLFAMDADSLPEASDTKGRGAAKAEHAVGDVEASESQEPSALITAALPLALLGIAVSSARNSRTPRMQGGPPRPTLTF